MEALHPGEPPRRDGLRDVNTTRHSICFSPSRFHESALLLRALYCDASTATSQMPDTRTRERTRDGVRRREDARGTEPSHDAKSKFFGEPFPSHRGLESRRERDAAPTCTPSSGSGSGDHTAAGNRETERELSDAQLPRITRLNRPVRQSVRSLLNAGHAFHSREAVTKMMGAGPNRGPARKGGLDEPR